MSRSAPSRPRNPDAAAFSAMAMIARGLLFQASQASQAGGAASPEGAGGSPRPGSPPELSWPAAKRGLREALLRDPLDSVAGVVLGGSYLFYLAEKGRNPKVESFWDALTFITTCLSVGYDDVFARTPSGKAIASFVMTFGPALSGAVLEAPSAEKAAEKAAEEAPRAAQAAEALAVQKAILARLDDIHGALAQAQTSPPRPPSP